MMDVTSVRAPPILRTMSANTVVVVTTLRTVGAGPPLPPAEVAQPVTMTAPASTTATSDVVRRWLIPSLSVRRDVATRSSWLGSAGLAVGAEPEQLEAVLVDAVASPALDRPDDRSQAGVLDVVATAAPGADGVVVMEGLA